MSIFWKLNYFSIIFFIYSCNTDKDTYIVKSLIAEDHERYSVEIDSLTLLREETEVLSNYFTYTTHNVNNTDYLIAYNPVISTIDIFNMTKRTMFKRMKLPLLGGLFVDLDKQDLDKTRSITDIYVLNLDSIFLNISNKKIIISDTLLNVKQIIDLDSIKIKNHSKGRFISYSNNFRMFMNDSKLHLMQILPEDDWKIKLPTIVSIEISAKKLNTLPIAYSDYMYHIKGEAGYLNMILTSEYQKEDVLTYNFAYESNIYQYNARNSKIRIYGGKLSKGKNLIDPIKYKDDDDLKKWNKHFIENTQFFNIIYDKYRNIYYRFSLSGTSYSVNGYFNSSIDKPLILMVFNENFEVIKEIELPLHQYAPGTWFITKEGLFISSNSAKRKSSPSNRNLNFHIIKVNKNLL